MIRAVNVTHFNLSLSKSNLPILPIYFSLYINLSRMLEAKLKENGWTNKKKISAEVDKNLKEAVS